MGRQHLLAVWNPLAAPTFMESHLKLLLARVKEYRNGRIPADNVYVWWGRLQSQRGSPLKHAAAIMEVATEPTRDDPGEETHLYITDYESLYVAHLGKISRDDLLKGDSARQGVPRYYKERKEYCDLWFRLWDIRRIVTNDTSAVAAALSKLTSVRSNQPVSIYDDMADLPLIVTEAAPYRYFDPLTRDATTDGRLWIEFDTERSGTGAMERELRENHFGDDAWLELDPVARVFVATGEKIYRDHAADTGFDFSPVVVEYAKAMEVQCNRLLRNAFSRAPAAVRFENLGDGQSVDLADPGRQLGLGDLARAFGGSKQKAAYMVEVVSEGAWIAGSLTQILLELAEERNAAAHHGSIDRERAAYCRRQLLGVGCWGHLQRLVKTRVKGTRPSGQTSITQ